MITRGAFKTCPDEIIDRVLSFLPIKKAMQCREISFAFKEIIDNPPKECAFLKAVRQLKDKKEILKGIHYDKEDLGRLRNINEKVAFVAFFVIVNAVIFPIFKPIWETPYIYPLAWVYGLLDAAHSPAPILVPGRVLSGVLR